MRTLLTILLLAHGWALKAQSWCPPGATWTFGISGWGMNGYQVFSYAGDTVIDGIVAQRIDATMYYINGISEGVDTSHWTLFTAYQNEVVLQHYSSQWDTLYHFGELGDRWYPIGAETDDPPCGMVEISDTSSMIIDGLSLRTWELIHLDSLGQPVGLAGSMIERLGTLGMFVPIHLCGGVIDYFFLDYRCYSDVDIQFMADTACDYFLGQSEHALPAMITPFPNPGDVELNVTLPSSAIGGTLTLLDAQGRIALESSVTRTDARIRTEALPSGIYLLRIMSINGEQYGSRWIRR